jgi:hypothetical protein
MVRRLPTFKGYTVDVRTSEFRKAEPGKRIEFIDFTSEEGMKLIQEMEAYPEAITTCQGETPNEVAYMADKAMRHELSYRRRAAEQSAVNAVDDMNEAS